MGVWESESDGMREWVRESERKRGERGEGREGRRGGEERERCDTEFKELVIERSSDPVIKGSSNQVIK